MTKRLKRILTIAFSLILTVSCALSVSLRFVHAELVAPEKEGSRTLLSIYDDELAPGMNVVWDSPLPDSPSPVNLSYVNSDDKDNVSKNIAIDCTRKGSLNTEMYIDFGKKYNIYTGEGFSDEELEDFYKKSSVEFWVKLNDKPGLGIELNEEECLKHPYAEHNLRHYTGALTDIRPPKTEFYF